MVRRLDEYYPRKSELGNGPLEVVVGDVLDVVSRGGGAGRQGRVTYSRRVVLPFECKTVRCFIIC